MSTTTSDPTSIEHPPVGVPDQTAARAADHLWMHFARQGRHPEVPVPVVTRGEGAHLWDNRGRRILDGLSGLFVVQVGHGRRELAEVAAKQIAELAYFPVWGYTTPVQAELAERVADLAPGDLNRVFFTTGGGEAVESAWKAAKQYFKLIGKPLKHKVISRAIAYHGTPHGALAITGLPNMKKDFEPVAPGGFRVPNTNIYRHPEFADDPKAFGRHGSTLACEKFGYTPDRITCAKGMSSGYGAIGAMIASEKVIEPFLRPGVAFPHGYTFGGHPVGAALSLANLDIMDDERLNQRVLDNEAALGATLGKLLDLPIVGDVRGDGYFWAIELVKDKATRETFDAGERERLVRGFLPGALFENGLYCRPDDRGDVVIQVAPPLICGQAEFDEMEQVLRQTLTDAQKLV